MTQPRDYERSVRTVAERIGLVASASGASAEGADYVVPRNSVGTIDRRAWRIAPDFTDAGPSVIQLIGAHTATETGSSWASRFSELASQWRRDSAMLSSPQRQAMHPAYQRIIGMGRPALPLILEDLRRNGGQWFWALAAIADEDPAAGVESYQAARNCWLKWGVSHHLIQGTGAGLAARRKQDDDPERAIG